MRLMDAGKILGLITALLIFVAAVPAQRSVEDVKKDIEKINAQLKETKDERDLLTFFSDEFAKGKVVCGAGYFITTREACSEWITRKMAARDTSQDWVKVSQRIGRLTRVMREVIAETIKEDEEKIASLTDLAATLQSWVDLHGDSTTVGTTTNNGGSGNNLTATFDASAGNNELAAGQTTRGFEDSNQVDVWVPFQITFSAPQNIVSAKIVANLKPIGDLLGTDGLGLKGSDGKTYWQPINFTTVKPEYQDIEFELTEPAVIEAIKQGKLIGVLQDDSAIRSVKLVIVYKK